MGLEVKNIDNEIPFDLPDMWSWTRVKYIASGIQYGLSNSAKAAGNFRLLRITDIQNNSVVWESVPYTTINEIEAAQYALSNGDLLFARTGGTVGKSYLVTDLQENAVFASYLIRVRPVIVNISFIKLFFETGYYWQQIIENTAGTGQPNVNGTKLGDLLLPVPPLLEQQRVVDAVFLAFKKTNLL